MPKLCEFENCRKQASYGYFYQKAERCKDHKEDRKPQYKICRCGKHTPNFGLPNDKRASYCIKCKTDEMINISKNKCLEIGCVKRPCFNFEGEKKGIYCSKHAKENMNDVLNKKCLEFGC